MTQHTLFDRPPIGDHPFDYADNSTPDTPPPEPKRRRVWFPEVADHEWFGIPDMPRVVNLNTAEYDLRIDRRTPYGNPYIIGRDGDRAEVIEKFRRALAQRILRGEVTHKVLVALGNLNGWNGVRLGCHCAPQTCHGDVWAKAIDAALRYNERQFLMLVRQHFTKERAP